MKNEEISQARYASGQGTQREVARAQSAVSEVVQQLFVWHQKKEAKQAYLISLLNRDNTMSLSEMTDFGLPDLLISREDLIAQARLTNPDLREALAMKKKDEQALSLAKLENIPDVSVGFQYSRIGAMGNNDPDDGRDAWMIPLKVTLPIWQNRIGSAISESRSNLNASEASLDKANNLIEYEIRNAYSLFMSQRKTAELYQNAILPQTELAFRSDQAGYEAGTTDIFNLIESEGEFLNAQMKYYEALADTLKNFVYLEKIVGKSLQDQGGEYDTP